MSRYRRKYRRLGAHALQEGLPARPRLRDRRPHRLQQDRLHQERRHQVVSGLLSASPSLIPFPPRCWVDLCAATRRQRKLSTNSKAARNSDGNGNAAPFGDKPAYDGTNPTRPRSTTSASGGGGRSGVSPDSLLVFAPPLRSQACAAPSRAIRRRLTPTPRGAPTLGRPAEGRAHRHRPSRPDQPPVTSSAPALSSDFAYRTFTC